MLLVYGTIGIVLAALFYTIVLLGCRNPLEPRWINDFLVGNIYVPVMIALIAIGVGCLLQVGLTIRHQPPRPMEVIVAIGAVAAGLILLKMLRIKKHLANYAAMAGPGKLIQPPVWTTNPAGDPSATEPPEKPISGKIAA